MVLEEVLEQVGMDPDPPPMELLQVLTKELLQAFYGLTTTNTNFLKSEETELKFTTVEEITIKFKMRNLVL